MIMNQALYMCAPEPPRLTISSFNLDMSSSLCELSSSSFFDVSMALILPKIIKLLFFVDDAGAN